MLNFKILVSEIDGEEFEYPREYDLGRALSDSALAHRFSKYKIFDGETIVIRDGEQMPLINQGLEIHGCLYLEGNVVLI